MTVPLPPRPSRRTLLGAGAGGSAAVLLAGCSDDGSAGRRSAPVSPERLIRESAVRETRTLLERYDATLAAHPALGPRLVPLRAAVAEHATALSPAAPAASAAPSPAPSGPAAPAAPPVTVPAAPAAALTALAEAERRIGAARSAALDAAPGELARLLASVAACAAVHAYLLTSGSEQS
ncbi:hypothetical protein [Streptomyces sp. NPDC089919]|uniref:hypothetical protein n=1 Tax=Streptomyces sp. NPDC089919 TaxID=3155188 RepID=UPI003418B2E4